MSKPPLQHLWEASYIVTDPEMSILINSKSADHSALTIHTRTTSDGDLYPEYGLDLQPGTRDEVIANLREAIAILEQLPLEGTIADICDLIGTTPESIEV